jgi:hypothetical protein
MEPINFDQQLKQYIQNSFSELGQKNYQVNDIHTALSDLFTYQEKFISRHPRKVFASQEILDQLKNNVLEYSKLIVFARIACLFANGGDVKPYQSKGLTFLKKKNGTPHTDDLLCDWGIHHLHPTEIGQKRGDLLLFVYLSFSEVFFLGFFTHTDFNNEQLLRIIKNNWPKILREMKGVKNCYLTDRSPIEVITPEIRKKLRSANFITFFVSIDGKYHDPLGWGKTSSGHSLDAIRRGDNLLQFINANARVINNNVEAIKQSLKEQHKLNTIDFDVIFSQNGAAGIIDKTSKKILVPWGHVLKNPE